MDSFSTQNKDSYFQGLNGLRGLAALIVFLCHAVGFFNNGLLSHFLLFDGAAAVVLFFILSGYSLSIKYVSDPDKRFNILSYIIKRFFRLYPSYIAGLVVILALRYFVFQPGMMVGLSDWVNSKWLELPRIKEIILYSLIIGAKTNLINSTMGAMFYLIVMSVIFPILIIPLRKINSKIGIFILLTLSYVVAVKIHIFVYLPLFVIGGIMAKYHNNILIFLKGKQINRFFSIIILLIAVFLFNIRFCAPVFFGYNSFPEHGLLVDTITSLGCLVLMHYALSDNRLTSFLLNKQLNYIGKISYLFYILHFPILLTITSIVYPLLHNIYISILLSLVATIIASSVLYKFVEKPFSKLGNSLSNRFKIKKWAD
jgi:peptidoglycan/LPS O-acetylase OafA/YrhL